MENIIPYKPSPTVTVLQAVMYMLGYRGEYYDTGTEEMEFDLFDYVHDLQEEADCAWGNAFYELEMLRRNANASPEAIRIAEEKVESAKTELEQANKLPELAEEYRLLINHEVSKVRSGTGHDRGRDDHCGALLDEEPSRTRHGTPTCIRRRKATNGTLA